MVFFLQYHDRLRVVTGFIYFNARNDALGNVPTKVFKENIGFMLTGDYKWVGESAIWGRLHHPEFTGGADKLFFVSVFRVPEYPLVEIQMILNSAFNELTSATEQKAPSP